MCSTVRRSLAFLRRLQRDGGALGVVAAPQFEVADERYAWLNDVQAISYGSPIDGGIGYDVYEVSWPGAAGA